VAVRIATWNTSKRPADQIRSVLARLQDGHGRVDVLVLTESRHLSNDELSLIGATGAAWRGDHLDAGVGVYTFNSYAIDSADGAWSTPRETESEHDRTKRLRRWTLGVDVVGPHSFFLLAVWAHNEWAFRPVNAAIEHYAQRFQQGEAIVAGDFNNGCRWDGTSNNPKDHGHTVQLLEEHGLMSAYHGSHDLEERGDTKESDETFWSGYRQDEGDHIDFIYAPTNWISTDDPDSVSIGSWQDYASPENRLSDHVPVVAELLPR
jgi:endonuclease/exonuclease/phosphatase family metal-dependent hydrolase